MRAPLPCEGDARQRPRYGGRRTRASGIPHQMMFRNLTTAGRTSQASTVQTKKTIPAPTSEDAPSTTGTRDKAEPNSDLPRPDFLHRTPALYSVSCWSNPLGGPILRRVPALGIQFMVRGRSIHAPHPAGRTRYPTPECQPCPKARTRDPGPTSSPLLHSVRLLLTL